MAPCGAPAPSGSLPSVWRAETRAGREGFEDGGSEDMHNQYTRVAATTGVRKWREKTGRRSWREQYAAPKLAEQVRPAVHPHKDGSSCVLAGECYSPH